MQARKMVSWIPRWGSYLRSYGIWITAGVLVALAIGWILWDSLNTQLRENYSQQTLECDIIPGQLKLQIVAPTYLSLSSPGESRQPLMFWLSGLPTTDTDRKSVV